jgi:hypothetical protein
MKWIAYNVLALAFLGCGVFLAVKGIGGWGWLIFCAVLAGRVPSTDTKEAENG